MKIIWQTRARASYRQVARYINTRFARKARQEFMQRVKDTERLIDGHHQVCRLRGLA